MPPQPPSTTTTAIWVGRGDIIGRYGLAGAVDFSGYPQGTVTIDLIGGLILGVLIGPWGFRVDDSTGIGTVFGGFTTFSSSTTVVVGLGAVLPGS